MGHWLVGDSSSQSASKDLSTLFIPLSVLSFASIDSSFKEARCLTFLQDAFLLTRRERSSFISTRENPNSFALPIKRSRIRCTSRGFWNESPSFIKANSFNPDPRCLRHLPDGQHLFLRRDFVVHAPIVHSVPKYGVKK
jgi:hypothetical protein